MANLMTVKATAQYLGIPVKTAYALVDYPGFPSIRVSPHRILISRPALDQWLITGGMERGLRNGGDESHEHPAAGGDRE